jgi:Zn-dependent protease
MRFEAGYLTVGAYDGVPIRIHWSTPLTAFVLGAGGWAPVFWIGYALVVLVHEIGHAVMVRRVGGTLDSIDVTGWGGRCVWSGDPTRFEDALVAAGGVLAQAILFAIVALLFLALGRPQNTFVIELVQAVVGVNLVLALLNLIPLEPLDGASAWRLLPYGITFLHERYGVTHSPPRALRPSRKTATRPEGARVVRLHDRLDRDLDRILRSSTRTSRGDDDDETPG